jgi:hypothetical protein
MFLKDIFILAFVVGVSAQNFAAHEIPAKSDNGEAGGIFSLRPGAKRPSQFLAIQVDEICRSSDQS